MTEGAIVAVSIFGFLSIVFICMTIMNIYDRKYPSNNTSDSNNNKLFHQGAPGLWVSTKIFDKDNKSNKCPVPPSTSPKFTIVS